jgi:hypothetical protein
MSARVGFLLLIYTMRLTQKTLLSHMQRGRDYTPTHLAHQFDEPTKAVRDMLCTLVENGYVVLSSHSPRMMQFRRTEATLPASDAGEQGDEPVATFPVTRTFQGSLSDYENSLAKHRSLAMLSRRS